MKIIRSYILKELFLPFILSLSVLTFIFLLGNLIQLANLVINKGVSLTIIGKIFVLYIPVLLGYTVPIACLISVILTFSRMSADNEILAIRANGIHIRRLLYPLIFLGFILSLISLILNDRVIPHAHSEQRKLFKDLGVKNPTALLEAGMFIHAFENQVIFIHQIDGNKLYNITIYQPQPEGKPTRTIIAKRGEFTPVPDSDQIKMKLVDGSSDEPNLKDPNKFYKLNFTNYFMTLDVSRKKEKLEKKPRGMTFKELRTEIDKLQKLFIDDTARLYTEYHRKITWSFAALIFTLIGFPIAVITHRREKSANFILAVVCAAFYYLMSIGFEGLCIKKIAPAAFLMWVPNILTLIIALFLNFKLLTR